MQDVAFESDFPFHQQAEPEDPEVEDMFNFDESGGDDGKQFSSVLLATLMYLCLIYKHPRSNSKHQPAEPHGTRSSLSVVEPLHFGSLCIGIRVSTVSSIESRVSTGLAVSIR